MWKIRSATAVTALLLLLPSAAAETLEESYAKLCAGETKSETCNVLRKALLDKLIAQSPGTTGPASTALPGSGAAPGGATVYRPSNEVIAKWGAVGRLALSGTSIITTVTDFKENETAVKTSNTSYVAYTWVDDFTLKEHHTQVEFIFNGESQAPEILNQIDITNKLDPARSVITRTSTMTSAATGTSAPQTMEVPVTEGNQTDYSETQLNGDLWFAETSYSGDALHTKSGKVINGHRVVYTNTHMRPAGGVTLAQIQTAAAQQRARTQTMAAQAEEESTDWLGALIGAGVGLAAGQAYGLDTEQTLGAMMKGVELVNPGSDMAQAVGSMGGQLLTGQSSVSGGLTKGLAGVTGAAGGAYPTKPNLASGACAGFTEQNYRTKALEGGGDSQLNTMCGQAFEYYTMYKRAIAQGYSEADANRTYAAHEQSARVASGFLQSHGVR